MLVSGASESAGVVSVFLRAFLAMHVCVWGPWEDYEEVELIQEAPRNRGCVTLMRSLERRGGFVAVKRMPNTWVTESSWDFARCWPRSSERPWLDMSLVRHLHRSGADDTHPRAFAEAWMP